MGKLTNEELLLLDNLVYTDYLADGRTVSEVIKLARADMANNDFKSYYGGMSKKEWEQIFDHIEKSNLGDYKVTNYVNTPKTGMRAACFVDDIDYPTDVNVAFRGTKTDYEWHDNGQGMYMADTPSQLESAEYINNLPGSYGKNITVTGHSKGGNRAQYVTVTTDRIGRCVSYDGQGFSQKFIDKYEYELGAKYAERKAKIKSISAEGDPVNALLHPIAGERVYIKTKPQFLMDNHKPNILLDDEGKLRKAIKGTPELTELINQYTIYIDQELEEPAKSFATDGLLGLLEKGGAGKESTMQAVLGVIIASGYFEDFVISYLPKNGYTKQSLQIISMCIQLSAFLGLGPVFIAKLLKWSAGEIESELGKNTVSRVTANTETIFMIPEGLKNEAVKLKNYQSDYVNLLQKLTNLVILLQDEGVWDSPATKVFIENYLQLKQAFEKLGTMMTEYAIIMESVATRVEEADNNLSTKISGITL